MNFQLLETLILAIINGVSIFLIIIVLANSFRERLYRWFVVMTILLMGWVDFAYLGYIESSLSSSLISYRFNLAFVAAFFFAAYVFYIECFLKINRSAFKWGLFTVSSIFVVLSLFTNTIIDSVVKREWGNEIHFGSIYPAFSIFAALMSLVFIYYFISRYFVLPAVEKKKIIYFLIGTFLFIAFNIIFNILTTTLFNTAEYQHFGDYSAILFLAFTAFAMVRRQFLNVKVALAAFVISAMSILLLIDIITDVETSVKIIIFIFFIGLCTILMRSILNEISQKALIQRKAEEQKDIIDVMGHEIRTPLSVIRQQINYHKETTLLEEDKWLAGEFDPKKMALLFKAIRVISDETDHTIQLVNDMLGTARIDKGRFELSISEFDVVELARKTFEFMTKVNDAKEFELKFDDSSLKNFNIKADETRIREAIDALLTNAMKYGKNLEGKKSTIEMKIMKEENNILLSVKDNGRGIDKEDIQKLGEKFVRLQPKTANLTRPGGTGLGLYVVKNIMNYHKGNLLIESGGIGLGSTFTLVIPLNTSL